VSTAFIDANRQRWPVTQMCRVLELSERSYYATKQRPASTRARADAVNRGEIRRCSTPTIRSMAPAASGNSYSEKATRSPAAPSSD
jgi:hypothetical protein